MDTKLEEEIKACLRAGRKIGNEYDVQQLILDLNESLNDWESSDYKEKCKRELVGIQDLSEVIRLKKIQFFEMAINYAKKHYWIIVQKKTANIMMRFIPHSKQFHRGIITTIMSEREDWYPLRDGYKIFLKKYILDEDVYDYVNLKLQYFDAKLAQYIPANSYEEQPPTKKIWIYILKRRKINYQNIMMMTRRMMMLA
jgi:hypothetical protein